MGSSNHGTTVDSFLSNQSAKVFVAGHRGLVGSAIVRKLQQLGFTNLLLRTHAELDLTRQTDVDAFFAAEKPQFVILAAAKIAGIKMCQGYRLQHGFDAISGMPTNLYGPYDNFHPENSHVLPALIRRFHEAKVSGAKEVVVWGTGSPLREFLHVDDLADGVVFLMDKYSGLVHVNVGSGKEVTIKELAELVKEVVGFEVVLGECQAMMQRQCFAWKLPRACSVDKIRSLLFPFS
ncbi:unnamed protein product, partial [Vitis vinifera]